MVYHYTSPDGLSGIIKNKSLWFTDCAYLNDMNEFNYILEPLIKAWKKICDEYNIKYVESDDLYFKNTYVRNPQA